MKTAQFTIAGNCPLIMQSDALADPLNEVAKAIKQITSKQKKTDEDHRRIGQLEFRGALYYDDDCGPYLPARNLERMLRDAGALSKLGKKVRMGLQIAEDRVPLLYAGPRTLVGLENDRAFHDRRSVVVNGKARTIRERPMFRAWSLKFGILYDDGVFNRDQVSQLVVSAGQYIGIGTYRPRYGRFEVEPAK